MNSIVKQDKYEVGGDIHTSPFGGVTGRFAQHQSVFAIGENEGISRQSKHAYLRINLSCRFRSHQNQLTRLEIIECFLNSSSYS